MSSTSGWYLDGYIDGEELPRRIPITSVPFRIGRADDVEGRLPVHHVSELHAEIYFTGDELWLRDHNSSNGTFRNRERLISDVPLHEGDIIHISTNEFVLRREVKTNPELAQTTFLSSTSLMLPEHFVGGTQELKELLDRKLVLPHYQPLVRLTDDQLVIGYEILGRGDHEGLPVTPVELFQIAEGAGLEVQLSELFRYRGLYLAQVLPVSLKMFVNTHPSEVCSPELLDSLLDIRKSMPDTQIVLETQESAVQSASAMRNLRSALSNMDIGLAYDNFGAGEARLAELVEVPPDLLKFDISLIHGIDRAPVVRQKMLETLVSMVNDLGIDCLAEGLETADEFRICRELGFGYGQGCFLGSPAPIHTWVHPVSAAEQAPNFIAG